MIEMEQSGQQLYDNDVSMELEGGDVTLSNYGTTQQQRTSGNSSGAWKPHANYPTSPVMDITIDSSSRDTRKRKCFISENTDGETDDGDSKTTKPDGVKKQNHSEIEKRRRDKMNTYITELSSLVPMCNAMARKLDKLTVLRMAVQHMKTIRGSIHSYSEGHYKPSFLSDNELKKLILEAAEGFLFVVGCDRGRILYASQSVSQVLYYSQGDLLGQSWFDILHPKDIAKVKEQLSSSDLTPREKLIDAKTMLPVKADIPAGQSRLCPGSRRSFFCRMKCKSSSVIKEEADTTSGCHRRKRSQSSDKKYCVIHCTGYLKSWAPAKLEFDDEIDEGELGCNLSCLVAVGRTLSSSPLPTSSSTSSNTLSRHHHNHHRTEFLSRHNIDGKFVYVDQRATLVLGYLPQEMLGTSCYEYYHQDDIGSLAECHKSVLQASETMTTLVYRFRTKDGSFKWLQTKWKVFYNPWTKDIEYLEARNTLVPSDIAIVDTSIPSSDGSITDFTEAGTSAAATITDTRPYYSVFTQGDNDALSRPRTSVGEIGRQIADEVLDSHRRNYSPSNSPLSEFEVPPLPSGPAKVIISNVISQRPAIALHQYNIAMNNDNFRQRRESRAADNEDYSSSNTSTTVTNALDSPMHFHDLPSDVELVHPTLIDDDVLNHTSSSTEGNDEAAMAVIFRLLEADAGLGGPVDFSGLPWPLS